MFKHSNGKATPPGSKLFAAAALAVVLGLGGLAAVQPAAADDGGNTTDVTIQVTTDDGNLAWSAPTQVPFKATSAGTLIGPSADSIAIKNLSAFPIRVKEMDTRAEAPFNLVDDVDQSSSNNDIMMTWNGVQAKPQVELADDGTWAMGYAGNADGTDVLPLTLSGAKIARVTADLSAAKKAATVTWTVEPTKYVKPEPKPDPKNGVAFAVYSEDDHSLDFYKRDRKPEVGETFNGKAVTKIYNVSESSSSSFGYGSGVKTVEVVDDGIKPVTTHGWFMYHGDIKSANLEKLDTSQVASMGNMFYYVGFEHIDLSTWDTSNVTDMTCMFSNCAGLTSLDLSGWDTSSVTDMGNMFSNCTGLTSLDLSGCNVSNVTNMNGMFSNCSSLTNLDLSGWDTGNVTDMGSETGMFSDCSGLTSLDLTDWDVSKVKYMRDMFKGCSGLTSLDLTDWNVSSVDTMYQMFNECSSLTTVGDLSGWNTGNVTNMYSVFYDCQKLAANCSNWDVANVSSHDWFNDNAPGVIPPNWNS